MPKTMKDLTGKEFGEWTVISFDHKKGCNYYWKCVCKCGKEKSVNANKLGVTSNSCGHGRGYKGEGNFYKPFDGTNIGKLKSNRLQSNNTSGIRGVSWSKTHGKWQATISFKKKFYNLGVFKDIKNAILIRKQAEEKIFGEFLEWYDRLRSAVTKVINANG